MRHRIVGMMQDRFRIDPAGRIDRAYLRQQCAEFVEGTEIRRCLAQYLDKGLLRIRTVQRDGGRAMSVRDWLNAQAGLKR